jgi:hypothetical protein
MKKLTILFIVLTFLTGFAMADHGIPQVPETQGIVTSTTIDALGNFASVSDIQWRITDDPENGLQEIPPLASEEVTIYESTYSEDSTSNGIGMVLYDKELDIETSGQITGQWNIDTLKELAFVGIDGARVVSTDTIFLDGAARQYYTEDLVICPFAQTVNLIFPTYCNRAEAGSTIDMTVANIRTTSTDRFVMSSGDHPVELNHDILVTELVEDLPSIGTASAYMEVLIQEAGGITEDWAGGPLPYETLMERIEFSEETTTNGDINAFEKLMHYESVLTGGPGGPVPSG